MALFTDNNKYAAEIIEVHPDLKYTVKFYDGIVKLNRGEWRRIICIAFETLCRNPDSS